MWCGHSSPRLRTAHEQQVSTTAQLQGPLILPARSEFGIAGLLLDRFRGQECPRPKKNQLATVQRRIKYLHAAFTSRVGCLLVPLRVLTHSLKIMLTFCREFRCIIADCSR